MIFYQNNNITIYSSSDGLITKILIIKSISIFDFFDNDNNDFDYECKIDADEINTLDYF